MISLAEESPDDWWEVEALLDLCFAPGREMLSSYRLRHGVPPVPELCLVARDEGGALAGAIRNWPVRIAGHWALLLGPVAVHPTRQGEGIGGLLMHEVIARAGAAGWKRIMLVGDLPYYRRFGFERLSGVDMPPPTNPDRILGLGLVPGAWDGVAGEVRRANDPAGARRGD
ncbi:MAG: N-acetyltransferase [Rubellimicrobium sp.]|nr:N-acetyltransferase [Rubellimicrobium sp.]